MGASPLGEPGAGEQGAGAAHIDEAQGALAGDHGVQSNYFTEVVGRRDVFVAGGDIHVHVDRGWPSGESRVATAATQGLAAAVGCSFAPAVAVGAEDMPSGFPGEAELPSPVRGRDEIIRGLSRGLDPRHHMGRPQVLAGDAGMGKTAIARSVERIVRSDGGRRRVWWVDAADEEQLSRGLTEVARDLGVSEADWSRLGTRPTAELGSVADRMWEFLEGEQQGWLLVIDNADNPGLLGPQDGTGFVRKTARGLLLITTRDGDKARWPDADLIAVGPLDPEPAAQVLADLAPGAGDRTAARALAQKLGNVPQQLKQAGTHLRQDLGSRTFDQYSRELDHHPGGSELSLDALVRDGTTQARPLLWLLACYAPASPVPEAILTSGPLSAPPGVHPLARLLDPGQALPGPQMAEHCRVGLRELHKVELVGRSKSHDGWQVVHVHPSIAEAARAAMDDSPMSATGPAPELVRASAAAAACAFGDTLDTGSAEHWRYYRMLTPHVEELLRHTATHLPLRARQELLGCMVLCIAAHQWSKAERLAEHISLRAMALASELGCGDTPVYLRLRHVHAVARREQGCHAEAAKELQSVLFAQLQLRDGTTRLDTLHTRQQLAWTRGRLDRWADAEEGLREVIRLLDQRQRLRGGSEEHAARVLRLHARCRANWSIGRQGRWREAEQGYRELLTDRIEVLGPDHPDTLDVRYNIGKALAWQGKWVAAEDEWRRNTADRARALGDQHPDTLLARQLLLYAGGYQAWQDSDRRARRIAVDGLEAVLSAQREKRGASHPETLETQALLAALRGDYSPAMTWPEDLPRPGAD